MLGGDRAEEAPAEAPGAESRVQRIWRPRATSGAPQQQGADWAGGVARTPGSSAPQRAKPTPSGQAACQRQPGVTSQQGRAARLARSMDARKAPEGRAARLARSVDARKAPEAAPSGAPRTETSERIRALEAAKRQIEAVGGCAELIEDLDGKLRALKAASAPSRPPRIWVERTLRCGEAGEAVAAPCMQPRGEARDGVATPPLAPRRVWRCNPSPVSARKQNRSRSQSQSAPVRQVGADVRRFRRLQEAQLA